MTLESLLLWMLFACQPMFNFPNILLKKGIKVITIVSVQMLMNV